MRARTGLPSWSPFASCPPKPAPFQAYQIYIQVDCLDGRDIAIRVNRVGVDTRTINCQNDEGFASGICQTVVPGIAAIRGTVDLITAEVPGFGPISEAGVVFG